MKSRAASLLLALTAAASPLGATGCATLAVATAPEKQAKKDDSPAAREAEAAFWTALHGGRYEDIGTVLEKMQAVYLQHPEDGRTAARLGFLHIWRLGESARLATVPATITDDMSLARRYFDEATKLAPNDPRFRGFLASTELGEGSIHHDEKLTRTGFFAMNDAVHAWPEFNLFTRGYVMSRLPWDSERYRDAVDDQWENLDVCVDAKVDRATADFSPYMRLDTKVGWKRACWDSWVAPHNLEGFFLNMGDMIVTAGDPKTARNVYAQAKLPASYAKWPYKDVLERRIAQADENVALFRAPAKRSAQSAAEKERRIMLETAFSCTGCHQE
jgi:hypothetical protein